MSSWALEEYCEDAIKDYLENKLDPGSMNLYPAWTDEEIKYPCAIIKVGKSSNSEGTIFNGVREIDVVVAVITEAVAADGLTPRERNRAKRDEVIEAFAQTILQDDLNALSPRGVVFSLAYIGDITRSVESDRRVFVSEIQLVTIASSKDLV